MDWYMYSMWHYTNGKGRHSSGSKIRNSPLECATQLKQASLFVLYRVAYFSQTSSIIKVSLQIM